MKELAGVTIYPIKDGRTGVRVLLGHAADDKPQYKALTGKTEEIAMAKMKAWLMENGYLEVEEPTITAETLVADAVKEFKLKSLLGSGISSRTYSSYENSLRHFETFFKNKPVGTISVYEINDFFSCLINLKNGDGEYIHSRDSLRLIKISVQKFFSRAVDKTYIKTDPFKDPDLKKITSKKKHEEITSYSTEELRQLYLAMSENDCLQPIFLFILGTGVRSQEAVALAWQDIKFDDCTVHIHSAVTLEYTYDSAGKKLKTETVVAGTKGKSERVIAVDQFIIDMLLEWREKAPSVSKTLTGDQDFVFGNTVAPRWTVSGLRSSMNKAVKKLYPDFGSIRLHRLRHTVATLLAEEGLDIYALRQHLGHTDIKTTMRYVDKDSDKLREKTREKQGRIVDSVLNP